MCFETTLNRFVNRQREVPTRDVLGPVQTKFKLGTANALGTSAITRIRFCIRLLIPFAARSKK